MNIITLGTLALDTIKTPSGKRKDILGGSAVHFAISAGFFAKVNLVANVGGDFPQKYFEFLKRKGINLNSVKKEEGRTFRWKGEYKVDLNTAITLNTELGVLSAFKPEVTGVQKKIKYVFLANVDPDIQAKFLNSLNSPKLVGLDSMNYWIKHKRASLLKLLKRIDIYVANDAEARQLTGEISLIKAAKKLSRLGPPIVIIKKGEHGVMFYFNKMIFCLPAYPVERIVDPTGAGDSFAGAFMGYLSKEKKINISTIKKSVVYGIILSSFNVEGFGLDRMARLKYSEIKERLMEFKQKIEF